MPNLSQEENQKDKEVIVPETIDPTNAVTEIDSKIMTTQFIFLSLGFVVYHRTR